MRQALRILDVDRIDHGIRSCEDAFLMRELATKKIPLTICPLSNIQFGMYRSMKEYPIRTLLDAGVRITINSDDPAFFGGSLVDNYMQLAENCLLSLDELIECARTSFEASFLDASLKEKYLGELDSYIDKSPMASACSSACKSDTIR